MLTQAFYYAFDTHRTPGKITCFGVRFETLEIPDTDETAKIPLLCTDLIPPSAINIAALKTCVEKNLG
jgi:hypothetical protein